MIITNKVSGELVVRMTEDEFNFLRRAVMGLLVNTPTQALATHTGLNLDQITVIVDNMIAEADRLDIEY